MFVISWNLGILQINSRNDTFYFVFCSLFSDRNVRSLGINPRGGCLERFYPALQSIRQLLRSTIIIPHAWRLPQSPNVHKRLAWFWKPNIIAIHMFASGLGFLWTGKQIPFSLCQKPTLNWIGCKSLQIHTNQTKHYPTVYLIRSIHTRWSSTCDCIGKAYPYTSSAINYR